MEISISHTEEKWKGIQEKTLKELANRNNEIGIMSKQNEELKSDIRCQEENIQQKTQENNEMKLRYKSITQQTDNCIPSIESKVVALSTEDLEMEVLAPLLEREKMTEEIEKFKGEIEKYKQLNKEIKQANYKKDQEIDELKENVRGYMNRLEVVLSDSTMMKKTNAHLTDSLSSLKRVHKELVLEQQANNSTKLGSNMASGIVVREQNTGANKLTKETAIEMQLNLGTTAQIHTPTVEIDTNQSKDDLPPYYEVRSDCYGRLYYVNHQDKTTSWKSPNNPKSKESESTGDENLEDHMANESVNKSDDSKRKMINDKVMRPQMCRFGKKCKNMDNNCNRVHECQFGNTCTKIQNCKYSHHESNKEIMIQDELKVEKKKMCKFGKKCAKIKNRECTFEHLCGFGKECTKNTCIFFHHSETYKQVENGALCRFGKRCSKMTNNLCKLEHECKIHDCATEDNCGYLHRKENTNKPGKLLNNGIEVVIQDTTKDDTEGDNNERNKRFCHFGKRCRNINECGRDHNCKQGDKCKQKEKCKYIHKNDYTLTEMNDNDISGSGHTDRIIDQHLEEAQVQQKNWEEGIQNTLYSLTKELRDLVKIVSYLKSLK